MNFRVYAEGERIVRLELDLSYNHRGVEKGAESRDFVRVVPLLERICGICSHSHTTNFCQGVESLMGLTVPPRARYLRTVMAELERLHSHLLWLGVAAHEIGFNTLFMWTWRDREAVLDTFEEMTGNRVNHGVNKVGGVRRDVDGPQVARALERVEKLGASVAGYREIVAKERTMGVRFKGVGRLSRAEALRLGTVGPTARASGVDYDTRKDEPYAAYEDLDFRVVTESEGDVLARTLVRVGELEQSLSIVRQALESLPPGEIAVKAPRNAPAADTLARYEAPRGELLHFIRTAGTDRVERLDIRTPTLANWTSVASVLPGAHLGDIPVVVAAIDPCLSCTSRVTVVDEGTDRVGVLTWDDLRAMGRRHYGGVAPP